MHLKLIMHFLRMKKNVICVCYLLVICLKKKDMMAMLIRPQKRVLGYEGGNDGRNRL